MNWAVKAFITTIVLSFFVNFTAMAQNTETEFDVEKFRELASRAEDVVSNHQASTDAFEILRSDLVSFRATALSTQEARVRRVDTVQEQIASLGDVPEDGVQETDLVAARRAELAGQLAEARAPLIVAQEAFRRASGLIGEIDKIIRTRKTTALLQLDSTPLNPVLWPPAIFALLDHILTIGAEANAQWTGELPAKVRKQNSPVILFLLALGLMLMIPATRKAGRRLEAASDSGLNNLGDTMRLVSSLAVFILPMLGLLCIQYAIEVADIFALRGDLLIRSVPLIGLSIFGANWLSQNLPQGKIFSGDAESQNTDLVVGGQRTIMIIGIIMALYYLLDGLADGADWPIEIMSVLRFPLVILLGYGLFRAGKKFNIYRTILRGNASVKSIPERLATLYMWACYILGAGGPILAGLGYSNAGATAVFSMALTLALSAAVFFIYILLVRFLSSPSENGETDVADLTSGGLYKVGLAFLLICASVPIFALIWGARVSDLSNLWFTLNEGIAMGDTSVSISDFLVFILIFFIGYTITRLLQSALRTAVLPNTRIEVGAQNALVTGFGYVGIFSAALIAITTTGLDLSNLAIVAGALSVGIGFGLQAIVSNFVSGIILLIERPVKIGDWVEIGAYSGNVSNISVRSTTIETFDRATVIVPNADLIAGTVINWTHNDIRGRVKVPIGVAYGTDPDKVTEVLLSIANDHPETLVVPAPWVVFMGFGADSMDFQLRAIIRDVNTVLGTTSDINYEIAKRFAAEGIEIPFAQRVVTIKNPEDFLPKPVKPARKTQVKPKT